MEKVIAFLVLKKGIAIGLGAGSLRLMQCIQKGEFKWKKAILHISSSVVVGYFMYEVGMQADLNSVIVFGGTFIMSINSFMTIQILTDKEMLESMINKFLKK